VTGRLGEAPSALDPLRAGCATRGNRVSTIPGGHRSPTRAGWRGSGPKSRVQTPSIARKFRGPHPAGSGRRGVSASRIGFLSEHRRRRARQGRQIGRLQPARRADAERHSSDRVLVVRAAHAGPHSRCQEAPATAPISAKNQGPAAQVGAADRRQRAQQCCGGTHRWVPRKPAALSRPAPSLLRGSHTPAAEISPAMGHEAHQWGGEPDVGRRAAPGTGGAAAGRGHACVVPAWVPTHSWKVWI
jgi:hypothetical protein